jgi:hypothetical protein
MYVLKALLEAGLAKEPRKLSESERLASVVLSPILVDIIDQDPDSIVTLVSELEKIVGGECASLIAFQKSPALVSVERLFKSAGLARNDDGDYEPLDEDSADGEGTDATEAVELLLVSLRTWEGSVPKDVLESVLAPTSEGPNSLSVVEGTGEARAGPPSLPVIGPSLPSAIDKARAERSAEEPQSSEGEDEEFGPTAYSGAEYMRAARPTTSDAAREAVAVDVREEWMLVPGTRDPFAAGEA